MLVCAYAIADISNRQKHALAYLSSRTEPKAWQRIIGCKKVLKKSSRPVHSTIILEREGKLAWNFYCDHTERLVSASVDGSFSVVTQTFSRMALALQYLLPTNFSPG